MPQGLGMGGHCLPNEGISKVWLTPPDLIRALGPFDLDPCAAPYPRPWPTAARHIELPDDGLTVEWQGRVWLNPPYTQSIDNWLRKMAVHKSGIALIFARTETAIWHNYIWPIANSIFFFEGRLWFHHPDGRRGSSNAGAPSALISYSDEDTKVICKANLKGSMVMGSQIFNYGGEDMWPTCVGCGSNLGDDDELFKPDEETGLCAACKSQEDSAG